MNQATAFANNDQLLQNLHQLAEQILRTALLQRQVQAPVGSESNGDRLNELIWQTKQPPSAQQELQQAQAAQTQAWQNLQARCAASIDARIFLPWIHLCTLFSLSQDEQSCLLFALLQQIDARYTQIVRNLGQTAATSAKHDEGLALAGLEVLLGSPTALRNCLFEDASLRRWEILHLSGDLRDGSLQLNPSIAAYLQAQAAPQLRIQQALTLLSATQELSQHLVNDEVLQQLQRFVAECGTHSSLAASFVLQLQAQDLSLARSLSTATLAELGLGGVLLDGREIWQCWQAQQKNLPSLLQSLRILCRDALLCNRVFVIQECHALCSNERGEDILEDVLQVLLESQRYLLVINGPARRIADQVYRFAAHDCACFVLKVLAPDSRLRQKIWLRHAQQQQFSLDATSLQTLVNQYLFTEEQVELVWREFASRRMLDSAQQNPLASLMEICRNQSRREVLSVAQEVNSTQRMQDLILPSETSKSLQQVLQYARQRHQVLEEWGFDDKNPNSKNLCILFHGPSGTGKTMAAAVIANELNLGLYKIDLASVVSKYIGETEKQLAQLFDQAEAMNIVLFFDEAESLFAKRTETRDAHDRYANLQTGYLLQRIEAYPGIVILSTNLLANIDKAFTRRFKFIIEYPFPAPAQRLQLWRNAFPPNTPLANDLDLALLAEQAALSGGNINNIALAAAFLAAGEQQAVAQQHVLQALEAEYHKLGRVFHAADFQWQDA